MTRSGRHRGIALGAPAHPALPPHPAPAQAEVTAAVDLLASMRKQLEEASLSSSAVSAPAKWPVNKRALDDCVARRMFVVPSFEIHGGVGGLYDYGPPGCALKENLLALWRQHFVLEDGILQIECTTLTPHSVLKTSGHVDKFEDLMVKDTKTGECYRADKLLEDVVDNLLTKDKGELGSARREELRLLGVQVRESYCDRMHQRSSAAAIPRPSVKGWGEMMTLPPLLLPLTHRTHLTHRSCRLALSARPRFTLHLASLPSRPLPQATI